MLSTCPAMDYSSKMQCSFNTSCFWTCCSLCLEYTWPLSSQLNTICSPRLISGKTATNVPSSVKSPLCPATRTALHPVKGTSCLVRLHVSSSCRCSSSICITRVCQGAALTGSVQRAFVEEMCALAQDVIYTSAVMEVWSARCRGKYTRSEVRMPAAMGSDTSASPVSVWSVNVSKPRFPHLKTWAVLPACLQGCRDSTRGASEGTDTETVLWSRRLLSECQEHPTLVSRFM